MSILPIASLIVAVLGLPLLYFLRHPLRHEINVPSSVPPDFSGEGGKFDNDDKSSTKTSGETSLGDRMREAAERERIAAGKPTLPNTPTVGHDTGFNMLPIKKPKAARALAAAAPAMQILLSLTLVSAGLFMILSGHYDPNSQHWAFATIGTVVGFWLKGK